MPKMPDSLTFWTVTEVAECIDGIDDDLCRKLWRFLNEAKNPTPMGGDGTNGTVEYPEQRRDPGNDDKLAQVWDKLTEDEQAQIVAGEAS